MTCEFNVVLRECDNRRTQLRKLPRVEVANGNVQVTHRKFGDRRFLIAAMVEQPGQDQLRIWLRTHPQFA